VETAQRRTPDRGFTLIEALVVIVVVGILVGVAVPLFMRQRNVAQDGASRATMTNAGKAAFAGINEGMPAADLAATVEDAVGSTSVDYATGASSTRSSQIVALMSPATTPTKWQGAVLGRPGYCTVVSAATDTGLTTATTVHLTGTATCRADIGEVVALSASDFQPTVGNPYNGFPVNMTYTWNGNNLTLTGAGGIVMAKSTAPKWTNATFSGDFTLGPTSNGAGLVFRGSRDSQGRLSGLVYQIDPGYITNGRPSLLIRQWTNGTENGTPFMRLALPAGVDVRATNNLKIDVQGQTYVAYLNGQEVNRGTVPSQYTGMDYGVRTWNNSTNTIGNLQVSNVS
jgi:prepilin-type N-terminal cleavage/methylation domain-containing protein